MAYSDRLKNQTAKFIGSSESSGYITGEEYNVDIYVRDGLVIIRARGHLEYSYKNMVDFLKNWEFSK